MAWGPDEYAIIRDGCKRSAAEIVPVLIDMLGFPVDVVDVGAGEGWFAREFKEHGSYTVAIDAQRGPEENADQWIAIDLASPGWHEGLPTRDLAVCLEVAEHLPVEAAESLPHALAALAPTVLFSAAIPGQGGLGHVTCRWQSWWAQKFAEIGYACSLTLRDELWSNDDVEPWYRQNLLLFTEAEELDRHPDLAGLFCEEVPDRIDVVHPQVWRRMPYIPSLDPEKEPA